MSVRLEASCVPSPVLSPTTATTTSDCFAAFTASSIISFGERGSTFTRLFILIEEGHDIFIIATFAPLGVHHLSVFTDRIF